MEPKSAEAWNQRAVAVDDQVHFSVKVAEGQPPAPLTIRFPLPDGRVLMDGPVTYRADGLATTHAAPFFQDPVFCAAVAEGLNDLWAMDAQVGPVHWRAHVAVWAARNGLLRAGDFVECGVNCGLLSATIFACLDFQDHKDRTFYLLDTFAGIPEAQMAAAVTQNHGLAEHDRFYKQRGGMARAAVERRLGAHQNVQIIEGAVPDTLDKVPSKAIAYLSIDMNVAEAEVAALRYFWPRMAPGALIVLDDYGYDGDTHVAQRRAMDAVCAELGVPVLALPTGQGLIQKP